MNKHSSIVIVDTTSIISDTTTITLASYVPIIYILVLISIATPHCLLQDELYRERRADKRIGYTYSL